MGAARHRRIAIAFCHRHQNIAELLEIALDDRQRRTHLKHIGCIHDVLGGGAPVNITPGLARGGGQLMHQRQDRIADNIRLLLQLVEIQFNALRRCVDGNGGLLRDHAHARLRVRERHFGLDIASDQRLVAEDGAHLRCAEHVAKKRGIENRTAH